MRKHSDFTQEEMRILKENPNTAKLTENRISLTLDAKQTILELNQNGLTPREIIIKLGYDPVMLGKYHMRKWYEMFCEMQNQNRVCMKDMSEQQENVWMTKHLKNLNAILRHMKSLKMKSYI